MTTATTVADLRAALDALPDDLPVHISPDTESPDASPLTALAGMWRDGVLTALRLTSPDWATALIREGERDLPLRHNLPPPVREEERTWQRSLAQRQGGGSAEAEPIDNEEWGGAVEVLAYLASWTEHGPYGRDDCDAYFIRGANGHLGVMVRRCWEAAYGYTAEGTREDLFPLPDGVPVAV